MCWKLQSKIEVNSSIPKPSKILILHEVQVGWDADDYLRHLGKQNHGSNETIEHLLLEQFLPINLEKYVVPSDFAKSRIITNPFMVMDVKDHIVAWFLPGILIPSQQAAFRKATNVLQSKLSKPKVNQVTKDKQGKWRMDAKYYTPNTESGIISGFNHLPVASLILQRANGPAKLWLEDGTLFFRLTNAILGVAIQNSTIGHQQ
ncbi:hypothetical protein BS17DRAFT_763844 [Gyrodon lividus]|nr:hypothetical protein BS17DRAFT_763844 [Gyrodon lividus]